VIDFDAIDLAFKEDSDHSHHSDTDKSHHSDADKSHHSDIGKIEIEMGCDLGSEHEEKSHHSE